MGKPNPQNLVPQSARAKEEQRRISSLGGKGRAEKARRRKTMREALELLMYHTELPETAKQMLQAEGITDVKDMNHQMVITRSLIAKAEAGDVQAYNAICAMVGEKPAEKHELSGDLLQKFQSVGKVRENDGAVPTSEDEIPE